MKKLFLALLLLAKICMGQQTADSVGLIGTLVSPTGVPLNGQLTLALNMANVKNVCTTPYQTAPRGPITFQVTNGVVVNGASANLLSNDCMNPRSTYYVTMYDTNHKVLFAVNWYLRQQPITSSHRTQDVGTIARNYFPPPGPNVPPPVPTACKAAAWPMNEGSGLIFHDSVAPADNMTLNGGGAVTWQTNTGLPGTTPYFNGTGYAAGASAAKTDFDGSQPFSVAFWTNNSSNSGANVQSQLIGSSTFTNPYIGWLVFENGNTTLAPIPNYEATGAIVFDLISGGFVNGIQVLCAFCAVNDDVLHYIVVTYDGSKKAAGVQIYKDGIAQTKIVVADTLTGVVSNPVPVQVGETVGGSIPFTGALAFVEIFCTALSPAQVAQFASAGPRIN